MMRYNGVWFWFGIRQSFMDPRDLTIRLRWSRHTRGSYQDHWCDLTNYTVIRIEP